MLGRHGAPMALRRLFERHELGIIVALSLALLVPGLWTYQLIDPWETHYGEVARRMLEDRDWVHLKWQNAIFRSKPILTFWLIGGGMKLFGVAQDGGYSGAVACFAKLDSKEFLKYLKEPARTGRTFFVITEAGHANNVSSALPTPRARETLETLDTSSNKFTLLRFTL